MWFHVKSANDLSPKTPSLTTSLKACFLAVEVAGLVFCLGLMIFAEGASGSFTGILIWATLAQIVIAPIALLAMPACILLRAYVARFFVPTRTISMAVGACFGFLTSIFLATLMGSDLSEIKELDRLATAQLVFIFLAPGMAGGLTWWWFEKPPLN